MKQSKYSYFRHEMASEPQGPPPSYCHKVISECSQRPTKPTTVSNAVCQRGGYAPLVPRGSGLIQDPATLSGTSSKSSVGWCPDAHSRTWFGTRQDSRSGSRPTGENPKGRPRT